MKKNILLIFGTRPEAIKIAPLYTQFKKYKDIFKVKTCITLQHREMLISAVDFFDIKIDYNLNIMKHNQTLSYLTARGILKINEIIKEFKPKAVCIQGDTTTAFSAAIAAYYNRVKIIHIEAGLRSYNKYSPFPEEINRIMISHLTDYHFAPTQNAVENLKKEGIIKNVWKVGNTAIDALLYGIDKIKRNEKLKKEIERYFANKIGDIDKTKIILLTTHRRESFGEDIKNIFSGIKEIAQKYRNIKIVYPVHLNPNVRWPAEKILKNLPNIYLLPPLSYPYFIWLMNKSYFVITDSGGIQEEAPSLGKPILVVRKVTERVEGIKAGVSRLIGVDKSNIIKNIEMLLLNKTEYNKMSQKRNPYGDGKASEKIVNILKKIL